MAKALHQLPTRPIERAHRLADTAQQDRPALGAKLEAPQPLENAERTVH